MSDKVKRSVETDLLQASNCDYSCPCELKFSLPNKAAFVTHMKYNN
jgi:hypothetical protein